MRTSEQSQSARDPVLGISLSALQAMAREGAVWWIIDDETGNVTASSAGWRTRFEEEPRTLQAAGTGLERLVAAVVKADRDKARQLWTGAGVGEGELHYRLEEPRGRPPLWTEGVYALAGARGLRLHVARPRNLSQEESSEFSPWQAREFLRSSPDQAVVIGADGKVLFATATARRLDRSRLEPGRVGGWLGRPEVEDYEAVLAAARRCREPGAPSQRVSCRTRDEHGSPLLLELLMVRAPQSFPPGAVLVSFRDVSGRSYRDPATRLYNRQGFAEYLQSLVEGTPPSRRSEPAAVLALGLESYDALVESHGTEAAEAALLRSARRAQSVLQIFGRPARPMARLGDDTVGLVIPECEGGQTLAKLVRAILASVATPVDLGGGEEVVLSPVCGVRLVEELDQTPQAVAEALQARRRAGAAGPGAFAWFDPERQARLRHQLGLEADLVRGLDRQELGVAFEPILTLDDHLLVGLEVSARWQHPELGELPAAELGVVARGSGMLHRLDQHLLAGALDQVASWRRAGLWGKRTVWLRMSDQSLARPGLPAAVQRLLQERELPGDLLVLCVSEGVAERSQEALGELMARLRHHGVHFCLDGVGHPSSSLSALALLPFDYYRLSPALLAAASQDNTRAERLVQAVVAAADSLEAQAVAEGLDDERLVRLALGWELGLGQGRALGAPLGSTETTRILTRSQR